MSGHVMLLAVLDGIAYAAVVFLVSAGLTLVFGVMRVLNIAHGSLFALGAYLTASLVLGASAMQVSPWLAYPAQALAAIVIGGVVGGLTEQLLLRRIRGQDEVLQILLTFAAFMILENLQRLIWGVQPYFVAEPLRLLGNVTIGGVDYTVYQIVLLPATALAVLFGLRFFLRGTLEGRKILAVSEDRETAAVIGVDVDRVYLFTFMLGAGLAALGGALAAPTTSLVPGMGADMMVLSFAVAATAGLGQIEGAAITALLIGIARSLAVYLMPELEVLTPYLIMVLVLIARPQGLFAQATARRI